MPFFVFYYNVAKESNNYNAQMEFLDELGASYIVMSKGYYVHIIVAIT